MSQKLVVISDVHVHPWSAFAVGSGGSNSRMLQTLSVLHDSLVAAEESDAIWICAGDLVHTQGLTKNVVLSLITDVFQPFPDVPKVIIWGNHDSRGKGSTRVTEKETSLYTLEGAVANMHLLDDQFYTHPNGLTIYGEGAQPRTDYLKFGGVIGHHVYVGHFIVNGCKSPTGYTLESKVGVEDLLDIPTLAIVGDVHKPQVETRDNKVLLIPGAPEQHNFGDGDEERGFWEITMELHDGKWWPEELALIESDSPKFITTDTLDDVVPDDGNFYRLTSPPPRDAEIPDNVVIVASAPTTVEQRDLLTGAVTTEDVLQRYVKENPPEETIPNLREIGKELLDGEEDRHIKDISVEAITAQNFFSYSAMAFEFEEGITLVTGDSRDFESNGAGKSTLFEALYWALFGKTTKGVAAGEEIRRGMEECMVLVHLDVEGTPVTVERRRGRSIEVDVEIDGEPITGGSATEVTNTLLEYLGVTEDIYRALAYYSQEDVLLFSRSTDGERKALLSDLCGLGMYERARGEARDKAGQAETKLERKKDEKERRQEELKSHKEALEEKKAEAKEWEEDHQVILEELREEYEKAKQTRKDCAALLNVQLERIQDRADNLIDMWTDNVRLNPERYMVRYEGNLLEMIEERDSYSFVDMDESLKDAETRLEVQCKNRAMAKDKAREIQEKIREQKQRRSAAKKNIKDYKERLASNPVCPTCGQPVEGQFLIDLHNEAKDEFTEADALIQELEADYEDINEQISDLDERIKESEERLAAVKQNEFAKRQYEKLQEKIEGFQDWMEERVEEDMERDMKRHERRCRERAEWTRNTVESEMSRLVQEVEKAKDALETHKAKTNPHESGVEAHQKFVKREETGLKMIEPEIRQAREMYAAYDYWTDAFSKKGIQSLLLEDIASEFNKARSDIFPLLTNGMIDVQFSTTARTKAGELREKTDFLIMFDGEEVSYDSLSGGQRRRVDLGVMLTLAVANSRSRNIHGVLGLLVFDEVFDYLDSDGAESLHMALQEVQQVIPKIYVITQDSEMASLFNQTLHVTQDEAGVSWVT